ncbi:TetR family transcriptional regulator [Salinibacterium sp. SYSU T00001]|uniref:TetR/AcrR family transcriptional regulator n=1 Tax=Homoserinimonas sedimenticola TaxID=2986805 RepID=UPI002235A9D8|nr:TetR family transcriptional regulator [Salinibacterium sedimenticola]MCW4386225.1 TetR family transcriptional regulator [Salinibacterium sedimenticola]
MRSGSDAKIARTDDPRAERTRAALLHAAVDVVQEQGTSDLSLTEIAKAAGVSRQAAYLRYRDLGELLLDAAIELLRSEVGPPTPGENPRAATLRMTEHFARHRDFYRAMLSGRSAYALHLRILQLLHPSAPENVKALETAPARDLGAFVTGGAGTIINSWVLDPDDDSTPEQLADRIDTVLDLLASGILLPHPQTSTP